MGRFNVWTATRGLLVLVLMGSLATGFAEPDELTSGTTVGGAPTVGITGGAPPSGAQISGEIVGYDPYQDPPLVLLATTAGQIQVLLTDPLLVLGFSMNQLVIVSGEYLAADLFSAVQLAPYDLTAADELTLGAPLGSSSGVTLGAPLESGGTPVPGGSTGSTTRGSTSGSTYVTSNGTTYNVCSSGNSGDNGNDAADNGNDAADNGSSADNGDSAPVLGVSPDGSVCVQPTATRASQADCSSGQTVAIDPENDVTVKTGSAHEVDVTLSGGGDCEGKRVFLKVEPGMPNSGLPAVSAELGSDNEATLKYTGQFGGKDYFRVWLDYNPNERYDDGEPTILGWVEWDGRAASPPRNPTRTPGPTSTPTRRWPRGNS